MAEEPKEEGKKSSLIKNAILFGIALLVPAILGVVVVKVFINPRLSGEAMVEKPAEDLDAFPIGMAEVQFDEIKVTVQTEDPDMVAPLLLAQVVLSCKDQMTADKIMEKKPYFQAEILKFHQGRTRSELNDPMVRASILEQIKQQANILLRHMAPDADLSVLRAMHLQFSVLDL